MSEGAVRTQGTELFVIDTVTGSAAEIIKFACPTGIQGLGGARDQIETTCLDTLGDKTYVAGLGNTGQVTAPFILIPRESSHQQLFALKEDGRVLHWIACLSESLTDPTMDSDGLFEPPNDRSSFAFEAFVADMNIDIAGNDVVRGTLTLQRSGSVVFTAFTPS